MTASGAVLITGANSGIGKEVARQLAEYDDVDALYLACRNESRADAARADLERTTGKSISRRCSWTPATSPRSGPQSTPSAPRCVP